MKQHAEEGVGLKKVPPEISIHQKNKSNVSEMLLKRDSSYFRDTGTYFLLHAFRTVISSTYPSSIAHSPCCCGAGSIGRPLGLVTGSVGLLTTSFDGNSTGPLGLVTGLVGLLTTSIGGNSTGSLGLVTGLVGLLTRSVGLLTRSVGLLTGSFDGNFVTSLGVEGFLRIDVGGC